ncbi:hypothetical protein SPWS13_4003 [Shewanella putrefaciens]|nr:hypothetical protein SPWS13_4003 [Shewanella putrefaciens]
MLPIVTNAADRLCINHYHQAVAHLNAHVILNLGAKDAEHFRDILI